MASFLKFWRLGKVIPAAFLALGLAGCSIRYTDLSAQQQAPHYKIYPHPANGQFLCLAAVPETPIYEHAGYGSAIIGYTKDVVAFQGIQNEGFISIQTDNALIGYIDGTKIQPYGTAHPGPSCSADINAAQQPIFRIN